MKKKVMVSLILGTLMTFSAVITKFMTQQLKDEHAISFNLETLVPQEFDGWKIDNSAVSQLVNPDDKSFKSKIYNQILERTYIGKRGEQVMLSIAYGKDQSLDLHVHRPEICYSTSGFDISNLTPTFAETDFGSIPVIRMFAKQGARSEPITYWIRVGDSLTQGWLEQKMKALAYGLAGTSPDGLLFRVSNISNQVDDSYRMQLSFLNALLKAVRSEDRYLFLGKLSR